MPIVCRLAQRDVKKRYSVFAQRQFDSCGNGENYPILSIYKDGRLNGHDALWRGTPSPWCLHQRWWSAAVPHVDYRVSEGLECIVDRAQKLEAKQQALELVIPGKDQLDSPEALLENAWIEAQFAVYRAVRPINYFGTHASSGKPAIPTATQ